MASIDAFRLSDNVEDRRRKPVAPERSTGDFGSGLLVPNVFQESEGLMTGLPSDSFEPQPRTPTKLSVDAGVNDLVLTPVDHDPFENVNLTPVDYDPFGQ